MAEYSKQIITWSFVASNDLSTFQYQPVIITGSLDQNISLATTSGGMVDGILQTKPQTAQFGTVLLMGVTKVKAGAQVSAGDQLTCTVSATAIRCVSGDNSYVFGRALSGVASGGIFTAVVFPGVIKA